MKKIYIFNPDTDYALASGSDFYTPSNKVQEMTRRMTLFPALWAEPGSVVLSVTDSETALRVAPPEIIRALDFKRLKVVDFKHLPQLINEESVEIVPWGWNRVLIERLRKAGVFNLPDFNHDAQLEAASRERTIGLNRFLRDQLPELEIKVPVKVTEVAEALEFVRKHGEVYFKDPWSSSGRGVLCTSGLTETKIEQWVGGVIRRRGFIMAETKAEKVHDFASLWQLTTDGPCFLGFSMFTTSKRGRHDRQIVPDFSGMCYMKSNLRIYQDSDLRERILSAQKHWLALQPLIPGYLSIDMMEEKNGNICPGVEINRRMTMGIAARLIAETLPDTFPLPEPFLRVGPGTIKQR